MLKQKTLVLGQVIGKNIACYRKDFGISQKDLATKVGLSPSTYNRYEKGKRIPTVPQLIDIAKTLGITIDALLGRYTP